MIQIYKRENTRYEYNGDMVLMPEECVLKAELNGAWALELTHPVDGEGRWRYLEEEAVVSVPTFQGKGQLFRVSRIEKEDDGISATAYPIFFDSADDHFLMDVRPVAKNGQQALDIMTAGSRYSGSSDITSVASAYFVRRNLMDAINGEEGPTFIQRWGGEILYDNFMVIINEKVGGDYGTEIRYGKNMAGIEEEVDMSGVVTRIVPVAYNGHMMSGDTPWVDSTHISKYAKIYTREMRFEDVKMEADAQEGDEDDGCTVCKSQEELDAALEQRCRERYGSGIDLPYVSIRVEMADISRTEEYKDYEVLETVRLGDTVMCRNRRLDITTAERVVAIEWDCIRDRVSEVTLRSAGKECFSDMASAAERVDSVIRSDGSVMAERIRGLLNAMDTQFRFQKNIAQKQDVRAILFEDMDEESPTYGAMCLGTQGFQISNRRTADGRDWDWTTAFTAQGGYADVLVLGILSDKTGANYWNLDTGEFSLSSEAGIGDETAGSILAKIAVNAGAITSEVERAEGAEDVLGSKIVQTAEAVTSEVTRAKGAEDVLGSKIVQSVKGIRLSVTNGTDRAVLQLSGGLLEAQSVTIKFTGDVVFASSLTDGTTEISGDNINSGTISGADLISRGYTYIGSAMNAAYVKLTSGKILFMTSDYNSQTPSYQRGSIHYDDYNLVFKEENTINGVSGYEFYLYRYSSSSPAMHLKQTSGKVEFRVRGDLSASGTKNRIVATEDYGERLLYCYEMPCPMFGDIGEGVTDENGECYIYLDDIFSETVSAEIEYQVFLQKEGMGDIWVEEKNQIFFLVKGTQDLKFAWEIKVKQRDYEYERMETYGTGAVLDAIEYEADYEAEISQLIQEQEDLLYETAQ